MATAPDAIAAATAAAAGMDIEVDPILYDEDAEDTEPGDAEGKTNNDRRTVLDGEGSDEDDAPAYTEVEDEADDDSKPPIDGHSGPAAEDGHDVPDDVSFWRNDDNFGQGYNQDVFADGVFSAEHLENISKHLPTATKVPWKQEEPDFVNERFVEEGTEPENWLVSR